MGCQVPEVVVVVVVVVVSAVVVVVVSAVVVVGGGIVGMATAREILDTAGGGMICASNTVESLANALEKFLLDPPLVRAVGEAGRRGVEACYSDEVMARGVIAATRSILGFPVSGH